MDIGEKIQKRAISIAEVRSNILDYISKIEDNAIQQGMIRRCDAIGERKFTEAEIVLFVLCCMVVIAILICYVIAMLFPWIEPLLGCAILLPAFGIFAYFYDSARLAGLDTTYDECSQLFIDVMSILTEQKQDKNARDWEDTKEVLIDGLSNIVSVAVANGASQESARGAKAESATVVSEASADTTTASESQKKGVDLRKYDIVMRIGDDGEAYPMRVYHQG